MFSRADRYEVPAVRRDFTIVRHGNVTDAIIWLATALVDVGFRITRIEAGHLHGERGTTFAMSTPAIPINVDAAIDATAIDTRLHVCLTDRSPWPRVAGVVERAYQHRFDEIEQSVRSAAVPPPTDRPDPEQPEQPDIDLRESNVARSPDSEVA